MQLTPDAGRLTEQSIKPLHPGRLHPCGRPAYFSCNYVQGAPNSLNHFDSQFWKILLDPHFLARAAKANKEDIGCSLVDPQDEVVHLLGRKIPVLHADDVYPGVAQPQNLDCLAVCYLGRAVNENAVIPRRSDNTNSLHEISTSHPFEFTAVKESSCDDNPDAVRDDHVGGFKKLTKPGDPSDLIHLLRIGTDDISRRRQTPNAIINELQGGAHTYRVYRELKYDEVIHAFDVLLARVQDGENGTSLTSC